MSFKAISYLELWWPLRSEELAYLCSVGIKHNTEHFCEFVLKLDQLFRRRRLYKIILNAGSGGLLFGGAEPFVQFW